MISILMALETSHPSPISLEKNDCPTFLKDIKRHQYLLWIKKKKKKVWMSNVKSYLLALVLDSL